MQKKLSHTRKKLIQIIPRGAVFLGIVCTFTLFLTAAGSQESQQSKLRSRHIVTSIPPLEGIVRALVDESIDVSTVIHGDPHSFIPRPSDAVLVRNADAVIVIDPSFERSFVPLLESHGNTQNLLILSQLSALELLAQRGDHHHHKDEDHHEDADHHEGDDHEGEDHDHDAAEDHHEDDDHEGEDHHEDDGHDAAEDHHEDEDHHEEHDHDAAEDHHEDDDHEGEDHHEDHDHDHDATEDHHEGEDHHEEHDHDAAEDHHEDDDHDAIEDHHEGEDHHEDDDHDAAEEHHEDDDHDSDDAIDYHIWLDPYNTGRIAQSIAQRLTELYPEQKATIEKNLQNFLEELAMLKARLDNTLAPIRNLPYSVVHDGLQYFAAAFSFSNSTALFLNQPEALSGLRFTELLEQIHEAGIQVLFLEEQFPPSAVRAIAERGNLRMVSIDPLGIQIPMDDRHYFALMESLAQTMHDALINN